MLTWNRSQGCRYMEYEQKGNQFLTIENEMLRMTFWLNKGADMIELRYKPKDLDVLWHTPLPIGRSGDYIAPASSALGAFFDYYPGGWQEVFPNSHLPTSGYKKAEGGWIDMPNGSLMVTPDEVYSASARYANAQKKEWPYVKDTKGELVNAAKIVSMEQRSSDSFHLELTEGWVALRNPQLDVGIGLAWDVAEFPFLWCWQGYGGNWGYPFYGRNYNIALEPFTNPIGTIEDSIASSHARLLRPNEQKSTTLRATFTHGSKAISRITVDGGESYEAEK